MKRLIFFLTMVVWVSNIFARTFAIIPQPSQLNMREGTFLLGQETGIFYDAENTDLKNIAGLFNEYLQKYYGFQLPENAKAKGSVTFRLIKSLPLGDEGYMLKVDKKGILITASAPAGIFYGVQTLKQMIPVPQEDNTRLVVNYVDIKDQPRFKWRGLHLDVGRHFFPVSFIKKYLDYMAMYKLNTFHWHLTEDQGWRLEIKKYPELTEISHWRDQTIVGHARDSEVYDGIGYGGFYTQDQVKDLVKYAAERYITIVPEIEMPGHTSAVPVSYTHLTLPTIYSV